MAVNDNSLRVAYSQTQPLIDVFNPPIVSRRAPTSNDKAPFGQIWINKVLGNGYVLTRLANNQATWVALSAGIGGPLTQLTTTDDGAVILPAGGNISLAGDLTNIQVTNTAPNTIGISLVAAPTILGNLTVNGSIIGLAGETLTGAFVQSGGNFTANDDAAGATIKLGTGAAAKIVSVGSGSGASSLTLRAGTGNMTISSTGNIVSSSTLQNSMSSIQNAAGAVTLETNGGINETLIISALQGTSATSVDISSVAGGVSVTGALATANALNLIASNAAGGLTSTVGTGGYSFVATNGIFTANTGTGTVSVSTDATNNTLNIGTGAGVKLLNLGSTSGASNTSIKSGSAGVNINDSNNQPTNINTGTSTGVVTIGNAAAGGNIIATTNAAISLDSKTASHFTVTGAADLTLSSTAGSAIVTSAKAGVVDSVQVKATNATGGVTISSGSNAVNLNVSNNQPTNINTGTSTGAVTIGNAANTGAISLNSAAASNFTVSGAGVDLTLSSVLGSTIISATEVAADAIQLTTAANGGITVNASSLAMLIHRAVNVDAAAGVNAFTSTSLTTGVAGIFTSSAATVDAVQLVGGGLKVAPVVPASGASPRVASGRFGVAGFTDNVAAAATVALAITNTMSTAASHVMATVQCATVGSACVIRNIDVSVAGTITCNVTNLGGTDTVGADVVITFWVLD